MYLASYDSHDMIYHCCFNETKIGVALIICIFRRRHSSGSSLVEALDAEEAQKLASCLDYILDIVGDTIPEIQSMSFT